MGDYTNAMPQRPPQVSIFFDPDWRDAAEKSGG